MVKALIFSSPEVNSLNFSTLISNINAVNWKYQFVFLSVLESPLQFMNPQMNDLIENVSKSISFLIMTFISAAFISRNGYQGSELMVECTAFISLQKLLNLYY